jgi:hypothetical protein
MPVRDFDDRYLVTATKDGQIKKTDLKAYANPRRGGIQAAGLNEGDVVIGVALTRGGDEIVLATKDGQAIRFKETDVRPMGRTAAGVRGVKLRPGDEVVDMAVMDPVATLLTVCENGYGKRTSFEEYRTQGRGGSGIINIRTSHRNGKVVAMKSMRDADELMLITQNGMIVRTGLNEMRVIGRATQGVRVIALRPGDKLVSVARVVSEDSSQGTLRLEAGEQPPEEDDSAPGGEQDEAAREAEPLEAPPAAPPAERDEEPAAREMPKRAKPKRPARAAAEAPSAAEGPAAEPAPAAEAPVEAAPAKTPSDQGPAPQAGAVGTAPAEKQSGQQEPSLGPSPSAEQRPAEDDDVTML